MSLKDKRKSKMALTALLSLFLISSFSDCIIVNGKPTQKHAVLKSNVHQSGNNPEMNQVVKTMTHHSSDLQSTENLVTVASVSEAGNGAQNQITSQDPTKIDNASKLVNLVRFKRSPYPPGFVAWAWREPCFCPPGQFYSCRCNNSGSSEEKRIKKRRTRSKKLKSKN